MLKKVTLITLLIIALAAVAVLAYQKLTPTKEAEPEQETGQGEPGMIKTQEAPTAPEFPEIDTSDWKTYRNEECGFRIKYPPNWNITEATEYERELAATGKELYMYPIVNIFSATDLFNISLILDTERFYSYHKIYYPSRSISVNGVAGQAYFQKEGYEQGAQIEIALPHQNKTYLLKFEGSSEFKPVYKELLSSFQFIVPKGKCVIIGGDRGA